MNIKIMPSTEAASPDGAVGSGHIVLRYFHTGFLFTAFGGLQAAVVAIGLLDVILLGIAVSHSNQHGVYIAGNTFYAFLFLVAFWCFMTSALIFLTSLTSTVTSAILPKTTFLTLYHAVSALFYVCSSAALLAQTSSYAYVKKGDQTEIKNLLLAAGSFGVINTCFYAALTVVGLHLYKKT